VPACKENFRDGDARIAALGKLSRAPAYAVTVRAAGYRTRRARLGIR
jgi:hypothetical protein